MATNNRHSRPLALTRLMLALLAAFPWLGHAAPDPCTADECTGRQSEGIRFSVPSLAKPSGNLNVYDLSAPIAPPAGKPGIQLDSFAGYDLTLRTGSASAGRIGIVTTNAPGLYLSSIGQPPAPIPDSFLGVALPGDPKVQGGVVSVFNRGDINTSTTGPVLPAAHGIYALSNTSGYPAEMVDALKNYDAASQGIGFTLSSLANPKDGSALALGSAVKGVIVNTRVDADGLTVIDGYGAAAGSFTVNAGGGIAFDKGSDFDALLDAGPVTVMLNVVADGTRGTVSKTDPGRIFARVEKKTDGSTEVTTWVDFDTWGERQMTASGGNGLPDLNAYVRQLAVRAEAAGGSGGSVDINHLDGTINTASAASYGVLAQSRGVNGGNGSDGGGFWSFGSRRPTAGGAGKGGGQVNVGIDGTITSTHAASTDRPEDASVGVLAHSVGGAGGAGGAGGTWYFGATGGNGGKGGAVSVTGSGSGVVTTSGRYASAIYALSEGGNGGNGGPYDVFTGGGGGGVGGGGGEVSVKGRWTITTQGADAHGIWAKSVGGNAGSGGGNGWVAGGGGAGGKASNGGSVTIESAGRVETTGSDAFALFGQSVGGFGGTGGGGFSIFYSTGGSGGSAGNGGQVSVTNDTGGTLITGGAGSHALLAQSIGGGGGAGGSTSGLVSRGSSGAYGGDGGQVDAINRGAISTGGDDARGIFAQSVGGGGGDGGRSGGLSAAGGAGSATSIGGPVSVTHTGTIQTAGERANAIYAQSVGGGGGNGGSSGGWFSIGGAGGAGGDAGTVTVKNEGALLKTAKADSSAIFAQSVGGGGGNGGNSASVGVFASITIGGQGGAAGVGKAVTVDDSAAAQAGEIQTGGERSHGIFAQSIGGGGGSGGFAVGAAVGLGAGLTVAIGGDGGGGGNAGEVKVKNASSIDTGNDDAIGLFAESVGGGGGSGGFSVAVSASDKFALGFSFGGKGAKGGNGNAVDVTNRGAITTSGTRSVGLQAQSVGGGGGSGGFAIAATAGGLGAFSLSLGGQADGGGLGQLVKVVNEGSISTDGSGAHALFAQSVGGGGGNGGFSIAGAAGGVGAGSVTVGGTAGGGGNGGVVDVVNRGTLKTTKNNAVSLFAQSVGGGGGNGGFSIGAAGGGVGAGSFNLGGSGAKGGHASTVTVINQSQLWTEGRESHGLFAQSVGGGGGNGGFALTGSGAGAGAGTIAIGGYGDGGGDGKLVDVTHRGAIDTRGEGAIGLFAQSVGGGGGNGGFSIAGSGAGKASGTLNVGGKGKGGGPGGEVKVDSNAAIATRGENAHGMLAQSIGGGGGNGGFAIAGSGGSAGAGTITVGGSAGQGGGAADVTLKSQGRVDTEGDSAIGLFAQSVGGGGGNGGFAFAGALGSELSLSVAVGGSGGPGGAGGSVRLDSSSAVTTHGSTAHAITAQSIGGGGGSGGMALTGTVGLFKGSGVSASITVGGSGGLGGRGGDVFVGEKDKRISGKLVTTGASAHGVFAQSVGGGGGQGGSALAMSFTNDVTLPEGAKTLSATLKFGGSGGAGNIGGVVTVNNAAGVETRGADAHGLFAQSVGGGGGSGGSAEGISLSTSGLLPLKESKATNIELELTAGGNGGSGNQGGVVAVDNSGAITTHGVASRGIFAQSIGGGGGSIAEGVLGKAGEWLDAGQNVLDAIGVAKTIADAFKEGSASGLVPTSLSLTLGANEGSGADAQAVTVKNRADIATDGLAAHGVFAQSVGAGGGDAKAYAEGRGGGESVSTGVGLIGEFAIGGKGAAAGSGGAVTIDHGGRIDTFGAQAHGLYAQSVGGGGGQAGAAAGGFSGLDSIGLGLAFARSSGNGGNGAKVTVLSSGTITTLGERSIGILAQSVGGGGGAAADTSGLAFFGSVGGFGAGGAVEVSHSGTIVTSGQRAHGIFAQSAGGKSGTTDLVYEGRGSAVNVTLRDGEIKVGGLDADGIVAQSLGIAARGDITVTIGNASVQGGSGSGAGVRLLDGANNRVVNGGAIGSLGGTAIVGTSGNDAVVNNGRVLGKLELGSGTNRFDNAAGALFDAGTTVRLGDGNVLANDGVLSPGGAGATLHMALSGTLQQSAGGLLFVDVDAMTQQSDRVSVSGSATLAGSVRPAVHNPAPVQGRIAVVSAAGGVSAAALGIDSSASAVTRYSLVRESNQVLLDYRIDFSDVAGLNANQRSVGMHINQIQRAGSTPAFAPFADMLFALPAAAPLAAAYDRLSPEPHGALAHSALFSALQFGDAMLSCRRADGEARFVREGDCGWIAAGASVLRQRASDEALGLRREGQGLSAGLQRELAANWHLGLAFGLEHGSVDVGDIASTKGEQLLAGAMLKHRRGDSSFSAALAGGLGSYDSRRNAFVPGGTAVASARPHVELLSTQLRVAHAFTRDSQYLRPSLDLGVTQITRRAFDESGAGAANLSVQRARDRTTTLRAAVEWGGEWTLAGGSLLRPFVRLGALRFLSGASPETRATLQGAPSGVDAFAVQGRIDKTIGELSAAVDLFRAGGHVLRLGYSGQFSSHLESHAATVKYSLPF